MVENKGFLYRTLNAIEENIFGVIIGASILGGIGMWTNEMYESHNKREVELERIKAGIEIKVGDYNGNELLDKYYEINGQKVPVEVDGKPVGDYFKR